MSDVRSIALRDISKYIKQFHSEDLYGRRDTWVCCAEHIDTKETKELNRRLGLHKINKQK